MYHARHISLDNIGHYRAHYATSNAALSIHKLHVRIAAAPDEKSTLNGEMMLNQDLNEIEPVDLARYCARIGYTGALAVDGPTLSALVAHHIAAIPFENIDVLLERGVDIGPEAVDAKLIGRQRGGYCFEQNGLFRRVLASVGFEVEALAARVLWRANANHPALPRTHCALRVQLEGQPWLVDVGFGGWVPTAPLRIHDAAPQTVRHEMFRVTPHAHAAILEARIEGVWRTLYELAPQPLLNVDYLPLNWFTSTHPTSIFRRDLMVARTDNGVRYGLLNGRLTIREASGAITRRQLDAAQLADALHRCFKLTVEPSWHPLLERIAAIIEE